MAIKIGQYTTQSDEGWRERYLVRKIMKKTAEISAGISYSESGDSEDFRYTLHFRYPQDLLEQQVAGAEYLPFKKDRRLK